MDNNNLSHLPEILTPKMVSQYLGIGYAKALDLLKSPSGPSTIKIGNAYKVPKEQFRLWLNKPGLRKVL